MHSTDLGIQSRWKIGGEGMSFQCYPGKEPNPHKRRVHTLPIGFWETASLPRSFGRRCNRELIPEACALLRRRSCQTGRDEGSSKGYPSTTRRERKAQESSEEMAKGGAEGVPTRRSGVLLFSKAKDSKVQEGTRRMERTCNGPNEGRPRKIFYLVARPVPSGLYRKSQISLKVGSRRL